jgi:hypothetical protein
VFGDNPETRRWSIMTIDQFFAVLNLLVGLTCLFLAMRQV